MAVPLGPTSQQLNLVRHSSAQSTRGFNKAYQKLVAADQKPQKASFTPDTNSALKKLKP